MGRADRPGPLVAVYWVDISGEAGWVDWQHRGTFAQCVEVGWVSDRDARQITLVRGLKDPSCAVGRESGAPVTIPMSVVRLIVPIDEPDIDVPWDGSRSGSCPS